MSRAYTARELEAAGLEPALHSYMIHQGCLLCLHEPPGGLSEPPALDHPDWYEPDPRIDEGRAVAFMAIQAFILGQERKA